jgi:hypothetical protein
VPALAIADNVIPHIEGEAAKIETEPRRILGAFRDGAFQADELILKCPSKYISGPPVPGKADADKNPYAGSGKGA